MANFFSKKIGVDLGTANTRVFVPGKGIVVDEPSLVAFDEEKEEVLAVGDEAQDMIGKVPEDINVFSPLKSGVIADYNITHTILSELLDKALSGPNIFKPEVVVGIPSGITSVEKRALIKVIKEAGARKAYSIPQAILSALGANISILENQGGMIVDIGAGTSEIAVISMGETVKKTTLKIAGNQINEAIKDYVKKEKSVKLGDPTAEKVKLQLGASLKRGSSKTTKVRGLNTISGLPQKIELSKEEITDAIGEPLSHIVDEIKRILSITPPELSSDIAESGITLTGGTANLTYIDKFMKKLIDIPVFVDGEPDLSLIKGTGVAIEDIDLYKQIKV